MTKNKKCQFFFLTGEHLHYKCNVMSFWLHLIMIIPVFSTVYLITISGDPITCDPNTKYTFNATSPFDAKVSQYSLAHLICAVYFNVMHVSTQTKLWSSVKVLRGHLVWIVIYILLSGTCPSALTMHTEELISWEETHKTHDWLLTLSVNHTWPHTFLLHFSFTLVSRSSCSWNESLGISP